MHITEDAPGSGKSDQGEHDDIQKDAERFVFDIFWECEHDAEKNRSNYHCVARRERRLTRAVWASVQDEKFIKNEVRGSHEKHGDNHASEFFVDFLERFARNPLNETK